MRENAKECPGIIFQGHLFGGQFVCARVVKMAKILYQQYLQFAPEPELQKCPMVVEEKKGTFFIMKAKVPFTDRKLVMS